MTAKGEGTKRHTVGAARPRPAARSSRCTGIRDADPPALVVQVGKTELRYHLRCIDDLHAMLDGARRLDAARQRRRAEAGRRGTVEAWARSPTTRSAAGTA